MKAVKRIHSIMDYYEVPAPLYRQMQRVIKKITQMRYNGYSSHHIKYVPGAFELCNKLDELEKLRRAK